ncbi:MAG: hypothetical protein KBT10_10315 [Bacteroidales bacterium]|nr:hypothetical protein [Candidatus Sodaliphilus aphodohippi]
MKEVIIESSFPRLRNDITIAQAQIDNIGTMPPTAGLSLEVVIDMKMSLVLHLTVQQLNQQATDRINELLFDDDGELLDAELPLIYLSWLWLAKMTILIREGSPSLALGCAENSLQCLFDIRGKRNEDQQSILASLLYNLAIIHHNSGDCSRAAKELTKAQQLLERLAKKNSERFSAMLLRAVEASADIIQSRTKQMNVFAHYQQESEAYAAVLASGADDGNTRQALIELVETLGKQGSIMLEMGNGRNAVKYFTKALRYQKKLNLPLGMRDLTLSIGLARALMRLINRRAAAEQLLTSLLPLARRLDASNEIIEIENLLNNKNKNTKIMTLLKGIF